MLSLASSAFGYIDSDLDGVEDGIDKCPDTPLTDLVGSDGCTKTSLVSKHRFDILGGIAFYTSDYRTLNQTDTLASTFQIDYYYENFSLQLASSYFTTQGNGYTQTGFYDTYITASYRKRITHDLFVKFGGGVVLPTYKSELQNNKTDYTVSLSLRYVLREGDIFAGAGYTVVGDGDVDLVDSNNSVLPVRYRNTAAYFFGAGRYFTPDWYASIAYNAAESIYKGVERIESVSVYGSYTIDTRWFVSFGYAYGLSQSASEHYGDIKVGYSF